MLLVSKKHVKPNPQINEPGGIIEKESFINISNIAFYNVSTKQRDKLQINSDEKKGKKNKHMKFT